jgi:hypothetical protein
LAAGRPGDRGKRVGLIVNAASVTRNGRPALQVMRQHGIHVVRLFAPEHGLSATLGAGERSGGGGSSSALGVVSLYDRPGMKPTTADLRGLDALVYDLQDAGVRFFTYVSTMIYSQRAAAKAGVRFVVLDRPNPLGGIRVAGPVADLPERFVSVAPGPLVHGLTAGEMARLIQRAQHSARRSRRRADARLAARDDVGRHGSQVGSPVPEPSLGAGGAPVPGHGTARRDSRDRGARHRDAVSGRRRAVG